MTPKWRILCVLAVTAAMAATVTSCMWENERFQVRTSSDITQLTGIPADRVLGQADRQIIVKPPAMQHFQALYNQCGGNEDCALQAIRSLPIDWPMTDANERNATSWMWIAMTINHGHLFLMTIVTNDPFHPCMSMYAGKYGQLFHRTIC